MSTSREEIRELIHDEVLKVVSSLKDTLILQLIGFMREEQTNIERGTDPAWVLNEPLTPVEILDQHPLHISTPVLGEYGEDVHLGDSEGDSVERQD